MRASIVILGAAALLIGLATQPANAGKGTDFDRFMKQIGKYAIGDSFSPKPKGLCICQDGSEDHTSVGVLTIFRQPGDNEVTVWCYVRFFTPEGDLALTNPCYTFEVLSK